MKDPTLIPPDKTPDPEIFDLMQELATLIIRKMPGMTEVILETRVDPAPYRGMPRMIVTLSVD